MRWQRLPGGAVPGIGMGTRMGTVPSLLSVQADLASPPGGLWLRAGKAELVLQRETVATSL